MIGIEQDKDNFNVDFFEVIQDKKQKIADSNIMLYQHAVAVFSGEVDEQGYGSVTIDVC